MVNNAGIGLTETQSPIHLMPDSTFDTVMAINARGVFLGIKHAIAQFLAQDPHPSGHRGWIVNTSSIMGLVGKEKNGAAYCASKGAVTLLTKQVAVEYAKVKVHCNCVYPGREFPLPYLTSFSGLHELGLLMMVVSFFLRSTHADDAGSV